MKISIEKKSNGIHEYISTIIEDADFNDLEFIGKILELCGTYNEKQIAEA
jgi:hypothetical protein